MSRSISPTNPKTEHQKTLDARPGYQSNVPTISNPVPNGRPTMGIANEVLKIKSQDDQ